MDKQDNTTEQKEKVVQLPLTTLEFGDVMTVLPDSDLCALSQPLTYLLDTDNKETVVKCLTNDSYKMAEGKEYSNLNMPFLKPEQVYQLMQLAAAGLVTPVIALIPDCDPADIEVIQLCEVTQKGIDFLAAHPIPEDSDADPKPEIILD